MRIITIALVLAVIGGIAYVALGLPERQPEATFSDSVGKYFQERMQTLGVEDVGQPIEGFDAGLLMMAFPGLTAQDFNGVETLEGHYEVRGATPEFVRDPSGPITSAERMVSSEGYATLLANVSVRLGIPAVSEGSVDQIISQLDTGDRIEVAMNQEGSALGVRIKPLEVLEDSRCPQDVQCIQAGTVRLRAMLSSGLGEAEQEFKLGTPVTTEAEEIILSQVLPMPMAGEEIDPQEYYFIFEVSKR